MIKKSLMAIAALCMVFSLTSCGGHQSDDPSTQTVEETATETPPEATEEEPSDETSETDLTGHTLMIYCGAGMTNPFQEISDTFQKETGSEMNVSFANAGQIQSQITTSGEGDLFIAGAAEELQPVETFVESKKDLVRHIPVLACIPGTHNEASDVFRITTNSLVSPTMA